MYKLTEMQFEVLKVLLKDNPAGEHILNIVAKTVSHPKTIANCFVVEDSVVERYWGIGVEDNLVAVDLGSPWETWKDEWEDLELSFENAGYKLEDAGGNFALLSKIV